MTVRPLIASVVLLAGCTPALNPTGAPHVRHEVQVEGRPYVVTVTGSLAVIAARGLRLPSVREEAIRQLRELGYVVDEDIGKILPPDPLRALSTLLPPPELDYPSRRRTGDIDGQQAEGSRSRTG